MTTRYIGSGPYCYASCLAMAFGDGTDPGLVEVLTGSPFGMQLLGRLQPGVVSGGPGDRLGQPARATCGSHSASCVIRVWG